MKRHSLKRLFLARDGFTLLDTLIAMAIAGLMFFGIGTAIFQIFSMQSANIAHMTAVKEVEKAEKWITEDALRAQSSYGSFDDPNGLTLIWADWDETTNTVNYIVKNGSLLRYLSINGATPSESVAIMHLNTTPTMTTSTHNRGVFEFKITSTVMGFRSGTETRSFRVNSRTIS
jgi:type II secretory pathway component PulJ